MLRQEVLDQLDIHAERFRNAEPFRHVVIDDFLDPAVADALLASFPAFERGNAVSENGEAGNKSTVERVRALGPAYAALDDVIQSRGFLDAIGRITGIDGLLYDPWYFGGGTHDNRHGQDLDPHVDFNRHPIQPWHRRLNLIVYLNHEWDDEWGGSLELHSDPRSPDDRVKAVTPLFNRCVIFETTEHSWHGFRRIDLPPAHSGLSRKSVALYFYTVDRPEEELAEPHSTIYVDRPLPEHIRAGHTLSEDDMDALRALLARRDQHIARLYRDTSRQQAQLESLRTAVMGGALSRVRYLAGRVRARLRR